MHFVQEIVSSILRIEMSCQVWNILSHTRISLTRKMCAPYFIKKDLRLCWWERIRGGERNVQRQEGSLNGTRFIGIYWLLSFVPRHWFPKRRIEAALRKKIYDCLKYVWCHRMNGKVISLLFIMVCSPFAETEKGCIWVMNGVLRTKSCWRLGTTTQLVGIPISFFRIKALVNLYWIGQVFPTAVVIE